MTTIYLGGTFDIPHYGHIEFFRTAKRIADNVVVALNTDAFVMQYKGVLPVMDYEERSTIIKACRYVDIVMANEGGYNSRLSIERIMPDFIMHGDDWTGEEYLKQLGITEDWLNAKDIKLLYTPYNKKTSTTNIKSIIKNQT